MFTADFPCGRGTILPSGRPSLRSDKTLWLENRSICPSVTQQQRLNHLSDFREIWYRSSLQSLYWKHEFHENRLAGSRTFLTYSGVRFTICTSNCRAAAIIERNFVHVTTWRVKLTNSVVIDHYSGIIKSSIPWVPGAVSPRVKSSRPSNAGVKHGWSCTSTPHICLRRAQSALLCSAVALMGRAVQCKMTQCRRSFCGLGTASVTS